MKKRTKPPDVLTALLRAIRARYEDAGDKTGAGVQLACLSVNPLAPLWYGAVHRYPEGPDSKRIVCNLKESGTLEHCILTLAGMWYGREAVDTSVGMTQKQLRGVLTPMLKKQVAHGKKLRRRLTAQARRAQKKKDR